MMAQKPLHELLQEDQEPFLLKNYIADRRYQLKKPKPNNPRTTTQVLQIKKRTPISQNSNFPRNFCKNACFFSITNSPDLLKSPLFEFQSPVKSPCKSPNAIFLHIPAKTAALLLEAAVRIQKQSSSCQKSKNNNGFGLFGSFMKRLTSRSNKTRKRELSDGGKTSVKDILTSRKLNSERDQGKQEQEMEYFCRSSSSAIWSESNYNEEKHSLDLDLETSSSGQLSEEEEMDQMEFVNKLIDANDHFSCYDYMNYHPNHFCESPFHFVLKRSPSTSGHRTPVFLSPATSPRRHKTEEKENNDTESLKKFQDNADREEEEEEDKEQCSPVSVLDPPFQDDDDGHDVHSEVDGFDLECSYAIVQRAKKQLLQKLRRFEKLAELDPVELEKRMLDQEQDFYDDDDDDDDDQPEEEEDDDDDGDINTLVIEQLGKSSFFCRLRKIPKDMKRLVSDLINEEQKNCLAADKETTVKSVCKRFESWKEVESNTIDMMVEQDFNKELRAWKLHQQQLKETASEIELGIFELLVEEFLEEQELVGWY